MKYHKNAMFLNSLCTQWCSKVCWWLWANCWCLLRVCSCCFTCIKTGDITLKYVQFSNLNYQHTLYCIACTKLCCSLCLSKNLVAIANGRCSGWADWRVDSVDNSIVCLLQVSHFVSIMIISSSAWFNGGFIGCWCRCRGFYWIWWSIQSWCITTANFFTLVPVPAIHICYSHNNLKTDLIFESDLWCLWGLQEPYTEQMTWTRRKIHKWHWIMWHWNWSSSGMIWGCTNSRLAFTSGTHISATCNQTSSHTSEFTKKKDCY